MVLPQSSSKLFGMYLFFAFLLKSSAGNTEPNCSKRDMSRRSSFKNECFKYRNKLLKKIRLLKWTMIYLEHNKKWWTDRLPIIWCKYTAESLFNFNVSYILSPLITGPVMSLFKWLLSKWFSCKRSQSLDNDFNFHCFLLIPER